MAEPVAPGTAVGGEGTRPPGAAGLGTAGLRRLQRGAGDREPLVRSPQLRSGSAREDDARRGLRCAPLPASTSFQKKPSAFSGVSCCPPYQQSHSKDFPGMSFSLSFLFPHLPLYSQALYKISGTGEI